MIRNHAEAVVEDKGVTNLVNLIGYNFRLGEIEAAIGKEQLKKLNAFVASRQRAAEQLSNGLKSLYGLRTPIVKPGCTHSYYVYPMVLDVNALGIARNIIKDALKAEGVMGLAEGYECLHLIPMYQKKIAYGSKGFPWSSDICHREVNYHKGICPVAEDLHERTYLGFEMCLHELEDADVELIIRAFHKVWENLENLG